MFAFDLLILPDPVATTPKHLGVNMLTQEYHDQINVWDWLAHSGATMVREFHPEKPLVKAQRPTARWESIDSREDFETYRSDVLEKPGPDGLSAGRCTVSTRRCVGSASLTGSWKSWPH